MTLRSGLVRLLNMSRNGDEYNAVLINNFQSVTYFLTITKVGTPIDIDAERPKMPDRGLQKLNVRLDLLQQEMKALDAEIKNWRQLIIIPSTCLIRTCKMSSTYRMYWCRQTVRQGKS